MKYIIKKLLREELSTKENLRDFFERFKRENPNPDFLINSFKNPDFRLKLTHDGGVKTDDACGLYNKCETNTFHFIAKKVKSDDHRYYPVSGWAFLESTGYFEHFWVYDAVNDLFLDVTPMRDKLPYAYGGVINKDINDDIANADSYNEVKFLLGKAGHSLYSDYESNQSNPILDNPSQTNSEEERLFKFIEDSPKYQELDEFIKANDLYSMDELIRTIPRLEEKQMTVRNNREYNWYGKLINQIQTLSR